MFLSCGVSTQNVISNSQKSHQDSLKSKVLNLTGTAESFVRKDTMIKIRCVLKLENISADSLKYLSFTCSYLEFFTLQSKEDFFHYNLIACNRNVLRFVDIGPGEVHTFHFWIATYLPVEEIAAKSVTLGMGYIKPNDSLKKFKQFTLWNEKQVCDELIWTNPISLEGIKNGIDIE